ncbi:hypothetical protein GGI43DRAFT_388073 [Trichoderma evansii]
MAAMLEPCDGITIVTKTLVTAPYYQQPQATNVQLGNSPRSIHGKEIILAAGAIRTPQVFTLSKIGSSD